MHLGFLKNNLSSEDGIVLTWEWKYLHLKFLAWCLFKFFGELFLGFLVSCSELATTQASRLPIEPERSLAYFLLVFRRGLCTVDCLVGSFALHVTWSLAGLAHCQVIPLFL